MLTNMVIRAPVFVVTEVLIGRESGVRCISRVVWEGVECLCGCVLRCGHLAGSACSQAGMDIIAGENYQTDLSDAGTSSCYYTGESKKADGFLGRERNDA